MLRSQNCPCIYLVFFFLLLLRLLLLFVSSLPSSFSPPPPLSSCSRWCNSITSSNMSICSSSSNSSSSSSSSSCSSSRVVVIVVVQNVFINQTIFMLPYYLDTNMPRVNEKHLSYGVFLQIQFPINICHLSQLLCHSSHSDKTINTNKPEFMIQNQ